MPYNKTFGKIGESIAERFLINKGYQIIKKNWRFNQGEIDLIVSQGEELRFIEVKTRSSIKFGYPEEAVDEEKAEHFYLAVESFLEQENKTGIDYHVDIISIVLNNQEFDIQWLKDAF